MIQKPKTVIPPRMARERLGTMTPNGCNASEPNLDHAGLAIRPAGMYSFPAAWAVRGLLDRLAGGVGLRRGRRDPRHLLMGAARLGPAAPGPERNL